MSHFVFVGIILAVVMFIKTNYSVETLKVMDTRTAEYDRNIDQATDDAMQDMIALSDSFTESIDLDACSASFFNSLYATFGVSDSETGQDSLLMYLPVLLVTDEDGFYIMHHTENESGSISQMQWTTKLPYYYSGSYQSSTDASAVYKYVINYQMDDEISLIVTYGGNTFTYEGAYQELETLYERDDILNGYGSTASTKLTVLRKFIAEASTSGRILDPDSFDSIRISAMVYQITKKMNYYVNAYNDIAETYGLSYTFSLPESSMDSFSRTIDSISLMAIFQGYPYGVGTDDVYSRFSVSSSSLYKTSRYVISESDGYLYYHRSGCSSITDEIQTYSSKEECAEHGAYPCPDCNP